MSNTNFMQVVLTDKNLDILEGKYKNKVLINNLANIKTFLEGLRDGKLDEVSKEAWLKAMIISLEQMIEQYGGIN